MNITYNEEGGVRDAAHGAPTIHIHVSNMPFDFYKLF
jgi:hypothetical protein